MVTCTKPGLASTGHDHAREFAPGDQIDPDAVILTLPGGVTRTWRDVLGEHLATHFTPERSARAPLGRSAKRTGADT